MRMRGLVRFKKGETPTAIKDLKNSEELLQNMEKRAEEDRDQAWKRFRISLLTLWCNGGITM